MKQGLLFDRIDMGGDNASVSQGTKRPVEVQADSAYPSFARLYQAEVGTEKATDGLVCQFLIKDCLFTGYHRNFT